MNHKVEDPRKNKKKSKAIRIKTLLKDVALTSRADVPPFHHMHKREKKSKYMGERQSQTSKIESLIAF